MKEKSFGVSWKACQADGTAHAKAGVRGQHVGHRQKQWD